MRYHSPMPRHQPRHQGQSLSDYSLIACGVIVAGLVGLQVVGGSVQGLFQSANNDSQVSAMKSMANMQFNGNTAIANTGQNGSGSKANGMSVSESNGSGTNVSSAEGSRILLGPPVLCDTLSNASDLKKLADLTGNAKLLGISQQALLSAANQAAYKMAIHPDETVSPELKSMRNIVANNLSDADLQKNPEIALGQVAMWTNYMDDAIEGIRNDASLTPEQRTKAVQLVQDLVDSTRAQYGEAALNTARSQASKINVNTYVNDSSTYSALRREAKSALTVKAAADNKALQTAMENGTAEN